MYLAISQSTKEKGDATSKLVYRFYTEFLNASKILPHFKWYSLFPMSGLLAFFMQMKDPNTSVIPHYRWLLTMVYLFGLVSPLNPQP